jgi:hypothetical protein
MAKLQVAVPESLGLTEQQIKELKTRFTNQLIEVLRGSQVEIEVRTRPKIIQPKSSIKINIEVRGRRR